MEINLLVSTYFLHNYETTTKFYFLFKTLTVVISKYIYMCYKQKMLSRRIHCYSLYYFKKF